jgi:trans-aconitate 2-methyltransferase
VAPGTTDWDADGYHRLSAPQEEWARRVLERLPLEGDETVLDAGCGSGRATRLLLERLPDGCVVGVDGSPSMIEAAAAELADAGDRIRLMVADLLELGPGLLAEGAGVDRVDAILSTATFHWIPDHETLFAALHSTLRPGGQLVAQCGGEGNVADFEETVMEACSREPFADHLEGFRPWSFFGAVETERRLAAAGFEGIRCWLEPSEVTPDDPRGFIAVSGLAPHLERLPEELREPFIDAVLDRMPRPVTLDYVRLNIDAARPA